MGLLQGIPTGDPLGKVLWPLLWGAGAGRKVGVGQGDSEGRVNWRKLASPMCQTGVETRDLKLSGSFCNLRRRASVRRLLGRQIRG